MTLELQQVIADRKKGTPGPYALFAEDHSDACGGNEAYTVGVSAPSGEFITWSGFDFRDGCTGFEMAKADANRTARLDELEAFYITYHNAPAVYAAAERLAEIAGKTAKGPEDFAELARALQVLQMVMGKPTDPETLAMIDALGGK